MHRASRKPVFQMIKDGKKIPCDGELWYRGYNIYTLIRSISKEEYGFEKIAYLLLFGEYPGKCVRLEGYGHDKKLSGKDPGQGSL